MELRDARWVGYCLAALLWAALAGGIACALPQGAGGGTLMQRSIPISERIVQPPSPLPSERIHVYTGESQAAQVFWEQPAAGRVHFTIKLPEGEGGVSSEASEGTATDGDTAGNADGENGE